MYVNLEEYGFGGVVVVFFFFFQAEDGIRDLVRSRGLEVRAGTDLEVKRVATARSPCGAREKPEVAGTACREARARLPRHRRAHLEPP